jgi:hypothetical protein
LAGLIAWLETQDPNTRYNYADCGDCLLARYFTAMGYRGVHCGSSQFTYQPYRFLPFYHSTALIPAKMNEVAVRTRNRTYGVVLKRARSSLT